MNTRKIERWMKGVANHRRVEILGLLQSSPKLSLTEISDRLRVNLKTVGEHVRRLAISELIIKKNMGAAVEHELSPRGFLILKFLRTLE